MRLQPHLAATLVATLALASCVSAPPPVQKPIAMAPAPAPPPVTAPPPLANDWNDWPLTPGTWRYAADSRGTRAMFGNGGDANVVLRCDRGAQRMYLSRTGTATTPLIVRTSSATRSLPVQPTGGAQPYVAAALATNDPLLDAMAFSRGRVAIQQDGAPILVVPTYAEIGRVIEDCRG
ncbi:MAG: hypothetical protein P0Y64_15785 [Candidatus Sphingomonas colombiensis]|nr:hypothetical protein [Sphingomonas sp.]WEK42798.1 MAG: hypothetical protein P0Y64_15785 [Sphingomonas sp.]